MEKPKKEAYDTPELLVVGNVDTVTKATWRPGSGDLFVELLLDQDTACNPNFPAWTCTTGS